MPSPTVKSSGISIKSSAGQDLQVRSQLGNYESGVAAKPNANPPGDQVGVDCGCEYKETNAGGIEGNGVGSARQLTTEGAMPGYGKL